MAGRPNHWLDCHVYNTAAHEKLMLDTLTEADWAALRAERYVGQDGPQPSLFDAPIASQPVTTPEAQPTPAPAQMAEAYLETSEGWL